MRSLEESDTTVHTHTFTQNIHIGNYKQIMFGVVCAWLDIFERSYCVLNFLFILYFDCAASSVLHGLLPSCGEQGLLFLAVVHGLLMWRRLWFAERRL